MDCFIWKVELVPENHQIQKYLSKKSRVVHQCFREQARLPGKPVVTGQLKAEVKPVGQDQKA